MKKTGIRVQKLDLGTALGVSTRDEFISPDHNQQEGFLELQTMA